MDGKVSTYLLFWNGFEFRTSPGSLILGSLLVLLFEKKYYRHEKHNDRVQFYYVFVIILINN